MIYFTRAMCNKVLCLFTRADCHNNSCLFRVPHVVYLNGLSHKIRKGYVNPLQVFCRFSINTYLKLTRCSACRTAECRCCCCLMLTWFCLKYASTFPSLGFSFLFCVFLVLVSSFLLDSRFSNFSILLSKGAFNSCMFPP